MNRPDIEAIQNFLSRLQRMDSQKTRMVGLLTYIGHVEPLLAYIRELEFILEGLRK